MHYKKLNTKDNVNFEEPLNEIISFRVTQKEKGRFEVIARENEISVNELIRNLARDYIFQYAISPELKKSLAISNKIEAILIKNRIISSRKPSNLSNLCEIFSDFEAFLAHFNRKKGNFSENELISKLNDFRELSNLVILYDAELFLKLKPQMVRIQKNKHVKALELTMNSVYMKTVCHNTNTIDTIIPTIKPRNGIETEEKI